MPRPRLGAEPYEKLTVRVDTGTMQAIQQYMQRLQTTSMGLRVDLGGTARRLLLYGLQYAKDLERHEALRNSQSDAGTGPVLAALQDHSPTIQDQSLPEAAQGKDQRTRGRKRAVSVKG